MNRAEKRRQQKLAEKAAKNQKHARPAASSLEPQTSNLRQNLDLAVLHHTNARLSEAEHLYQQVLQADPNQPVALHLLGTINLQRGKIDEAIELISKSLIIQPEYTDAHSNLGLALHKQGHLEDAVSSFERAITLKPDFAEAHCNKGVVLGDLNRTDAAKLCFQKAISLKSDYIQAHFNLGNTLRNQGRLEEAANSYHKAITLNPNYAEAYVNLGMTLHGLERPDEAMASYRKAMEIRPHYAEAHGCFIFIQDLLPDIDQTEQQAERKRWNDKFIQPLAAKIQPHANNRDPDRRLRIGYVSADFCHHSAYLGFGPLILDHDRENFDVICYDGNLVGDDVTESLRHAATAWRSTRNKSDEEVAQIIREDAIDILVDLSGHTIDNRLQVFGYKPAPLQITGIGHLPPGLSTIDYRLTTLLMTPPEEEKIYPENPIYLNSYCAYTPPRDSPPIVPAPCQENGFLTFGFLGRFSKTSEDLLALWASIMRDVPGSHLLLKFSQLDDPTVRQNIKQTFSAFGITEDRLILLGQTDLRAHLEAHNLVDIVFDTFPHGGGITTLDSLWMGVPVIGQVNPKKAGGRMIESICHPLGLADCATESAAEYHDIALNWAPRIDELSRLRQELRERFSSVYFRFHQDVEKSYRLIWRRWCAGEAPSPLHPETALS